MIALRFLPREEWEAELRRYGCRPAVGLTKLNTAEFWHYPWGGYPFTVPHQGGNCLQRDLEHIIILMAKLAPDGWQFPSD